MKTNIIVFGQLVDVIGTDNLAIENVNDTNELTKELVTRYPALDSIKYAVAVDKKIISGNTLLSNNTVALLPPFSGG